MPSALRYFPFESDEYEMTMNARAGVESLIEVDTDEYRSELELKDEVLAEDHSYYFQCDEQWLPLAWEAISLLLPDVVRNFPEKFKLAVDGSQWTWTNNLLGTTTQFKLGNSDTLPYSPIDWLGRQVQEDLILMSEAEDGDTICVAGSLCFGSFWSLDDKIGQTFLQVHKNVPGFAELIGQPSDLMMRRLKSGRPTSRLNWTICTSDRLNLASRYNNDVALTRIGITAKNAGYRCFLRVERQTFSRLPETRGILFTIHTYINPVEDIVRNADYLERFTSVLKTTPRLTIQYKGIASYYDQLIAYLESKRQPK